MSIANSNVIAKVAAVVAGLGLVFSSFAYAVPAKAATTAELEAQVAALLAQIQALQGGSSASAGAAFTMDMTIGASGAEVTRLQNWLISKGYSIPAGATGYFGAQTAAAVAAYQKAKGITPAAGYFGPMTRAAVNAEGGASTGGNTGGNTGGTSGDLEGGAGSVDSYELISSLNNEDLGEDEEDVEVMGLEVEVDDGSDIELTAVRVAFFQTDNNSGDASDDLEDVASEVSIWLDGEEVARVDADEFTDDNDYTKTISLDAGAIIRAEETGELVIGLSGVSNLDSADEDSAWAATIETVRFQDADGATISDDTGFDIADSGERRVFNVTSFADAADINLKITSGDDEINNARVITVDDEDETEGVEVFSFNVEVEGDSNITINELPVEFVVTGAAHLDDIASDVYLMMDGDEVGSENVPTDDETVTFEDLDLELEAGEEYEFVVALDVYGTDGNLDAGDTVLAKITGTERDLIDAEDESGEDIDTGDMSGTATGEAHVFYEDGIVVEAVSVTESKTFTADEASEDDQATYTFKFDVTAGDEDIFIDRSATETDGDDAATDGVVFSITNSGSNSTVGTLSAEGTVTGDDATGFKVRSGETREFTLTVVATAGTTAFAQVAIEQIGWSLDNTADFEYTVNLDDLESDPVYLSAL